MVGYVIVNSKKEYLYEYSHGTVRWTKHQEIADTYNKREDAVNIMNILYDMGIETFVQEIKR